MSRPVSGRTAVLAVPVALLSLLALPVLGGPAHADPVPAPYAASTHGDLATLSASALPAALSTLLGAGSGAVGATVGHATTTTDSTAGSPTSARAANLEAGATGLGSLSVDEVSTTQTGDPAPESAALAAVGDATTAPLLSTSVVAAQTQAAWAGAAACVAAGAPLAGASTQVADLSALSLPLSSLLGTLPDLVVADADALATTGTTTLETHGAARDVVATSTGELAGLTLLDTGVPAQRITATVTSGPELEARSTGTGAGAATYTFPEVELSVGGSTITLDEGNRTWGATGRTLVSLPGVGDLTADVEVRLDDLTSSAVGAHGVQASVAGAISVDVELHATDALPGAGLATLLGTTPLTVSLDLLPLAASASAPAGGVECDLAPPTITAPAQGSVTTDRTPAISGSKLADAGVSLVVDGGTPVDLPASPGTTWEWTPSTPLALGPHTAVATQTLQGLTSGPSPTRDFSVGPLAPTVNTPADGSTTTDTTPEVTGTAVPGAQVQVTLDGGAATTVTAAPGGDWTMTPTTPLGTGDHTVSATQTVAGLTSASSPENDFEVVAGDGPPEGGPTSTGGQDPTSSSSSDGGGSTTDRLADTGLGVLLVPLGLLGLLSLLGGGYLWRRGRLVA